MADKRITISIERRTNGEPGELQICINPEGRAWLIEELQGLSERNDHFHLWSPDIMGDDGNLNTVAYDPKDSIVHLAKVLFRLDEWDREFYPHVMDASKQ